MQFRPLVYDAMNRQVPVAIEPMTPQDAALTDREPLWQTSWTSEYLADENYEKYAKRIRKSRKICEYREAVRSLFAEQELKARQNPHMELSGNL